MKENFFQIFSYRDDEVINYVNFLKKLCKRLLKHVFFFSKVNLVTTRKKIFKIVFEILEAKLTYKLNIYSLIC